MASFVKFLAVIIGVGLVVFAFGPRPDLSQNVTFSENVLDTDLDSYLAASEAKYDDIRDGLEKQIIWHDHNDKTQTEYSVVYLHGFSASKVETAPIAQNVAKAFSANLYFTRLAGHGRDGEALGNATLQQWFNDTTEAVAIGEKLGRKIILISASTGSTLATWAANQVDPSDPIFAMVMISPNFAIHGASTGLMNMPWAEYILPIIVGKNRSFETRSPAHAHGWTHSYPTKAIFPMAALLKVVDQIDVSKLTKPALFIYSNDDKVVIANKTKSVMKKWGGPVEEMMIVESDDPNNHVIAGDILSPSNTQKVSERIISWVKTL